MHGVGGGWVLTRRDASLRAYTTRTLSLQVHHTRGRLPPPLTFRVSTLTCPPRRQISRATKQQMVSKMCKHWKTHKRAPPPRLFDIDPPSRADPDGSASGIYHSASCVILDGRTRDYSPLRSQKLNASQTVPLTAVGPAVTCRKFCTCQVSLRQGNRSRRRRCACSWWVRHPGS